MTWISDGAVERLRAAADAPDLSGTRYRLLEYLARGGMGAVYVAYDTKLERRVALKVLSIPDADGELGRRLERESRILARLEHPGIVPVHDTGFLADGRPYYAMKLVDGRRLAEYVCAASQRERLRVFLRILDAVGFAHAQGVIHRDLKPENVMVGPFGEVLVLDWGVAKVRGESTEADRLPEIPVSGVGADRVRSDTLPGTIIGTRGYMSPEQAQGAIDLVDERSDVYALGAILRFLHSGRSPQGWTTRAGERETITPPAADADGGMTLPRPLAAIVAKALSDSPDDRYSSTDAMARDVSRWFDGLAVSAYPEGIVDRLRRIGSRHATAIILVLVYLLTRALVIIFAGG